MKTWTLDQLWYAHSVCFPADFEHLIDKYDPSWKGMYFSDFRRLGGLFPWMHSYSRADMDSGMGELFDNILTDLIGEYK